jgi:hypothetical protein
VSAEAYASLLEKSGHRVVRTASAWWYEAHPRWYLSIPFHAELTLSATELDEVFEAGAWVLRYPCPISIGRKSYRSVCTDPDYALSTLGSTARRATRRGLERCTVRRLPFTELERHGGLELSRSTLVRQHRRIPADHDQYWRRHYAAAGQNGFAECWAAFAGDRLAAFLIAVTVDDCVYLPVLKSSSEHLPQYPNNALVYSFTRDALDRPGVKEVSWGLESLLPSLAGLERFKQGMGFERRPIGQRIEMTGWLNAALRGPATWAVHWLASHGHGGQTIDRAAATLRVHAGQPRL